MLALDVLFADPRLQELEVFAGAPKEFALSKTRLEFAVLCTPDLLLTVNTFAPAPPSEPPRAYISINVSRRGAKPMPPHAGTIEDVQKVLQLFGEQTTPTIVSASLVVSVADLSPVSVVGGLLGTQSRVGDMEMSVAGAKFVVKTSPIIEMTWTLQEPQEIVTEVRTSLGVTKIDNLVLSRVYEWIVPAFELFILGRSAAGTGS